MRARLKEEIVVTMSVQEAHTILEVDFAALDEASHNKLAPLVTAIESVIGAPAATEDDHSL